MQSNGFFKTFDGTKLFYSIEGSGPPLVFCYGIVCSKLHWSYQMDYFKQKGYTVIWFDYRGHNNSDVPKDLTQLTLENIAKDLGFLLDELKIPSATLLGHSMGVNIVLEFFRLFPNRVDSMVLANGSARAPLETLLGSNFPQLVFPLLYQTYMKYPNLTKLLWNFQGKSKLTPWLVAHLGFNPNLAQAADIQSYVDLVFKMDAIILLQLLKDYDSYDATSWLHKINVPTLIIAGEKDLLIPRESQELMHQLVTGSRFELIRNGSHCPQMDIPELVNIMLERFFSETKRPRKSGHVLAFVEASREASREVSTASSDQISRHGEQS